MIVLIFRLRTRTVHTWSLLLSWGLAIEESDPDLCAVSRVDKTAMINDH